MERGCVSRVRIEGVWQEKGRLIRVIGSETNDKIAHGPHHQDIPPHGYRCKGLVPNVLTSVFIRACNGLEIVAVEMERMLACVVVVEDDLYDVVVLEDIRVRVDAIDGGVAGEIAS